MVASGLGATRQQRAKVVISLGGMPRKCRSIFLDSGAHSLYNLHCFKDVVVGDKVVGRQQLPPKDRYLWYSRNGKDLSKAYRSYLDSYTAFIKEHKAGLDYYVTVDTILNPELSWLALKYLEDKGINPIPVIHDKTPMKWVAKHLEAGYKFIGLGGLGQESTRHTYVRWADQVYDLICDNKDRLPLVKTHGFAVTSYPLLLRYPWWSVDSSSAFKSAGFGAVMVPHKRRGEFTFAETPYVIGFSHRSTSEIAGKHYRNLAKAEKRIVCDWLDLIGLKVGKVKGGEMVEYGVLSSYNARVVANLRFFERLCQWLPKWPWPFNRKPARGFFNLEGF